MNKTKTFIFLYIHTCDFLTEYFMEYQKIFGQFFFRLKKKNELIETKKLSKNFMFLYDIN